MAKLLTETGTILVFLASLENQTAQSVGLLWQNAKEMRKCGNRSRSFRIGFMSVAANLKNMDMFTNVFYYIYNIYGTHLLFHIFVISNVQYFHYSL